MTDRELLERAAKAAGLYTCDPCGDEQLWCADNRDEDGKEAEPRYGMQTVGGVWNPLVDDASALRLVVKLGLRVHTDNRSSFPKAAAFLPTLHDPFAGFSEEALGSDPYAATRRAIVRAAAALAA